MLPPNTPTIYLVAAGIALSGVLFGAFSQIATAAIQRGHERRMKLFDVKRVLYAKLLAALTAMQVLTRDLGQLRERSDEAERGSPPESYELGLLAAEVNATLGRAEILPKQVQELISELLIIAPKSVRRALRTAIREMDRLEDIGQLDLGELVSACAADVAIEPRRWRRFWRKKRPDQAPPFAPGLADAPRHPEEPDGSSR